MNKTCVICGSTFQESHANVLCCSMACGKSFRQRNFDEALRKQIGQPIQMWLTQQYHENHWTYRQICKSLNINMRTLMRYIETFQIPKPTKSEAVSMQWVRDHKRKLNSPNVVAKGTVKRSLFLKAHPQKAETALIDELDKRNVKYEFQYVATPYVLDFAFPEHHLVIELDNPRRSGRNLDRLPKTRIRTSALQKQGWTVVYFRIDASTIAIADALEALLHNGKPNTPAIYP